MRISGIGFALGVGSRVDVIAGIGFWGAEGMSPEERRENYLADVTYVTNSELGFDFLRDNLAQVLPLPPLPPI